ncbi:hypothetical protein NDU88_009007 [Pleurodeles waltl]|uniref:Uncharacterized protein n=1 Tax=Pleurodeles waltl TaxID=8319 RepID=A0AAV7QQH3_PLEWA|nr:hypothetical protein NDU88_009007 [Pleurodeles waltl]
MNDTEGTLLVSALSVGPLDKRMPIGGRKEATGKWTAKGKGFTTSNRRRGVSSVQGSMIFVCETTATSVWPVEPTDGVTLSERLVRALLEEPNAL